MKATFISEETWEAALPITRLTLSPDLQIRVFQKHSSGLVIRDDIVEDYRELLAEEVELGPLEVIEEVDSEGNTTGRILLADGFHRFEAHRRLGHETVACRIRRGDELAALLLAAHTNGGRGLQYGLVDRRKVASMVLRALAKRDVTWSDTQIAQLTGIHRTTVAQVRADLSSRFSLPINRQVMRNGNQMYTMMPGKSPSYQHDPLLDELPDADKSYEPQRSSQAATAPRYTPSYPKRQNRRAPEPRLSPPQPSIYPDRGRDEYAQPNTTMDVTQSLQGILATLNSAAITDEMAFIFSWRDFRGGEPDRQGVINHTMPASLLPVEVRAALLRWLQPDE
jgi:hypothetical protein